MERVRYTVSETLVADCRLDVYISQHLELFSRSQLKLRVVKVLVDGKISKLSKRLQGGEALDIFYNPAPSLAAKPEDIELDIIYEDANVIVVNKPQGMVVHPARGNYSGTLVNALLFHLKELGDMFAGDVIRPGIVHRLDKDTSGVIISAKNPETHESLALQFRKRLTRKVYLGFVKGALPDSEGRIETGLRRDPRNRKRFSCSRRGGKKAVTVYKVLRAFPGYSLVALKPLTGRTHQLRVHTSYLRCPVLGDPIYSRRDKRFPDVAMMLHAYRLKVAIPSGARGGDSRDMLFRAPLPLRFKQLLREVAG